MQLHLLDMSQTRTVANFAKEFATSGQELNVLVSTMVTCGDYIIVV